MLVFESHAGMAADPSDNPGKIKNQVVYFQFSQIIPTTSELKESVISLGFMWSLFISVTSPSSLPAAIDSERDREETSHSVGHYSSTLCAISVSSYIIKPLSVYNMLININKMLVTV